MHQKTKFKEKMIKKNETIQFNTSTLNIPKQNKNLLNEKQNRIVNTLIKMETKKKNNNNDFDCNTHLIVAHFRHIFLMSFASARCSFSL